MGKVGKINEEQRYEKKREPPKTNQAPSPTPKHERNHQQLKYTLSDCREDTEK
jgi:hypothetical protein